MQPNSQEQDMGTIAKISSGLMPSFVSVEYVLYSLGDQQLSRWAC